MQRIPFFFAILALFFTAQVSAQVNIAATTSSLGMVAREVGGDAVRVTDLAPPDRDVHFLQARPSIMSAIRRADLLVSVGAELEVGWLPAAIQGANNRRVYPGQPGYFEAASHVDLLGVGGPADRSFGDVHPDGNPHFHLDPVRLVAVARALAEHLGKMDADNAELYQQNAEQFAEQVKSRLPQWQKRAENVLPVLQYHKDVEYFAARFDVPVLGSIEPLPGIPPSARHLRDLVSGLQSQGKGVIVHTVYQPERGPRFIEEKLGWPRRVLYLEPPVNAGAQEYFELIDTWLDAVNDEPG